MISMLSNLLLQPFKRRTNSLDAVVAVAYRRLLRASVVLAVLLGLTLPAAAQEYNKNKPDQALKTDARVDPSTLGMSIGVPLGGAPGRAGTSLPISLRYSSKLWRLESGAPFSTTSGIKHTWAYPKYSENSMAGWTSSLEPPRIEFTGEEQLFGSNGQPLGGINDQESYGYYVRRIHLHLPDGSSHELRKDDSTPSFPLDNPVYDFSGIYYAVDGSRMRYDYDARVLYLPDGSRYYFGDLQTVTRYGHAREGRWGTTYVDRHGNTMSYNMLTGVWTDTLGRTFTNPLFNDPAAGQTQTYQVPGVNGNVLTYKLHWKSLGNALRVSGSPSYVSNTRCVSLTTYQTISPYLFTSGGNNVHVCTPTDASGNLVTFNPVVLARIELPAAAGETAEYYDFKYNVWGEIEQVVHPGGGYERYGYDMVASLSRSISPHNQANRGVIDRWVSPSGTGAEEATHHWLYSITKSSGFVTATTTAPDGTRSERLIYANSFGTQFGFETPLAGMSYDERIYNASNQMLRRTLTGWSTVTPPGSTRPRDPHVTKTVGLILDTGGNALAAATEMHYDGDLNADWTKKYNYASIDQTTAQSGAIGAIANGTLARTDEATYLVNDASIPAATRDAYRARNMLGLPSSSRVKNAAGAIVAQSEWKYDEAAYPLLTYGAVAGWNDPGTSVRGNATTTRSWLDTTGAWIETHARYDQVGNARYAWDARGNASETEYSPSYHYAYPTLERSAVPDPTNARATNTALVQTTVYDFATGRVTSTKDANGQASGLSTTYEYNDPMSRLTKVNNPDGGWTSYAYGRNGHGVYVRTRTAINATQNTDAYQYFDGLGRSVRSFQSEGAQSSTSDTQYDAMGRVSRVSNPYFSAGAGATVNPSGHWTTTAYDALGRVASVTTPDNAVTTNAYSGVQVTVTDQAGKVRRSVSDALGRLTQVVEPNAAGSLTAADSPITNYTYDALGNLRKVDQGGQFRYFMYDSLSRLVRAKNPEQDAHAGLATAADPVSGNTQWSLAYAYDNNGNLASKTDARNVTTVYQYDNINRNTNVDYSNTPTVNPDIMRYYDGAAGGRGRIWYNYKVESGTWEHTAIDGYDSMGRVYQQRQAFHTNGAWSPLYYVTRSYNLIGGVSTQGYPSGRTVSYPLYDTAGRLKKFTGNLGDGVARTYATGINPANGLEEGIQYDEAGRIRQERFGTQTPLYHKQIFNLRGQLGDIRLGLGYDTWSTERGVIVIDYGTTSNNGDVVSQQYWIPTDASATAWDIRQTNYAYDSLNRVAGMQEYYGAAGMVAQQWYVYDRWGNRTINQAATSNNLPKPEYTVNTQTNRLGVPGGYAGVLAYDAAGNQTYDSHSPNTLPGSRTYDAENRMTAAYYTNNQLASSYTYDADGQRTRRRILGSEVWQIYGIEGELLAEYAASAAPTAPQKEYGYRNGELLVTAESNGQVNWLVTDHLGTPRMIADLTGSLAGIKRHDYLPFGEEVGAGVAGRTTGQGYVSDHVRQKFTGYEKDGETGLDYARWRYYSSTQGRFTSVDPENAGANLADPQSWNAYVYVSNNPLRFVDPNGLSLTCRKDGKIVSCEYALNQIRGGNFESLTYTNSSGVSLTVRRADFYTTSSSTRGDTEVVTTNFNQSGFLKAAANFAGFLQQSIERNELGSGAFPGFGGGDGAAGGGSGGGYECPSCPAFKDDPYNPDVVKGRQNARNTGNTPTSAEAAKRLGFTSVVKDPPFNSHGQKVFTDGSGRYITRDVDSHRGGVWKMFNRRGERLGTYDANLKRIGN